jgi:hypothetical protein
MRAALTAALLLLPLAPALADPLPERANQVVDYRISVRLDAATHRLDGREHLVWRNPSADAVSELWFHLYLNAFKNTKSTFMKESGGQLRGIEATSGRWGWIDVTSLRLADGTNLTPRMHFEHPDDDNADDQTVVRVPLPESVGPGASVALDIVFKAQLPQVFARTGYYGDFHMVGQWFPKLGVYEPAGMRGRAESGWNCHQFHANSEFYADYGHYLVDITVPTRFIVGATGERKSRRDNPDGTTSYTYEQGDVHDFAWTADPTYVEVRRTFSATGDVTQAEYEQTARLLGRTLDEVKLSDVDITLLIHPYRLPQVDRHINAAKAGIKYFGLWYGRYPYRTLTVVDPAPGGGGAGGMEYPTLITAGTSFVLNYWPFSGLRGPEGVTVHEFGHQFWYAMIGNNEFEEAWLDEGINSYSTGRVMERVYGRDTAMSAMPGLHIGEVDTLRMTNSPEMRFDTSVQPAWSYAFGAYGFYSYQKPEIVLRTLENDLGEQTMARVMRTFQERWRFRHPSSDDFFAVADEVAGRNLDEYFKQTIRGSGILDYEVGSATSVKIDQPLGVFDRDAKRTTVDVRSRQSTGAMAPEMYATTVIVRRRGEVVFPVEVAFKFAGKPPERQTWDGRARWKKYQFTRPQRLEWVDIDPDRKVILDADWLNNSYRLDRDNRAATKWAGAWMFFVQNLLAFLGM